MTLLVPHYLISFTIKYQRYPVYRVNVFGFVLFRPVPACRTFRDHEKRPGRPTASSKLPCCTIYPHM